MQNTIDLGIFQETSREIAGLAIASPEGITTNHSDGFLHLQLRFPNGIFSHETALYLHGLLSCQPDQFVMTFVGKTRTPDMDHPGFQENFVKREKHPVGVTERRTASGSIIRVYNMERAVLDVIRSKRNRIDADMILEALQRYAYRKDRNIPRLLQYARILNMEPLFRQVLAPILAGNLPS